MANSQVKASNRLAACLKDGKLEVLKDKTRKHGRQSKVWQKFGHLIIKNSDIEVINSTDHTFETKKVGDANAISGNVGCFDCDRVFAYRHNNVTTSLQRHMNSCKAGSSVQPLISSFAVVPSGSGSSAKNYKRLPTATSEQFVAQTVKFVVNRLRPFSIVEDSDFQNLIQMAVDIALNHHQFDVRREMPSTKTLTKRIAEKAEAVVNRIVAFASGQVGK